MAQTKEEAQALLVNSPVKVGQRYEHFKGGEYEVIATAIKEDTLEPLVIYHSFSKDYVWARTLDNFTETVTRDGQTHKRFTLIKRPE